MDSPWPGSNPDSTMSRAGTLPGGQPTEEDITRLRQVITRLARELNKSAATENLSVSQASLLALIAGRGPIKLSELVRIEGVHPTMVSRMVSKLEGAGLIARFSDPTDLRSAIVSATKQGQSVHARIRAQRTETVANAITGLDAAQVTRILDALPELEALAEQFRLHRP